MHFLVFSFPMQLYSFVILSYFILNFLLFHLVVSWYADSCYFTVIHEPLILLWVFITDLDQIVAFCSKLTRIISFLFFNSIFTINSIVYLLTHLPVIKNYNIFEMNVIISIWSQKERYNEELGVVCRPVKECVTVREYL